MGAKFAAAGAALSGLFTFAAARDNLKLQLDAYIVSP